MIPNCKYKASLSLLSAVLIKNLQNNAKSLVLSTISRDGL